MLIRFEATNFRSIYDTVELSMVAVDRDREAAREAANLGESLLTVAAIYGANASGKSNVLAALAWICSAVHDSLQFWVDGIPVERFAFGEDPHKTSEFAIEALIEGVRFEYLLEVNDTEVLYEALYHYPQRKRRLIFERNSAHLKLQRGLGKLSGTRELLTGRTLALTVARRFEEPLVSNFANFLLEINSLAFGPLGLGVERSRPIRFRNSGLYPTLRWFEGDSVQQSLFSDIESGDGGAPEREQALALLRLADLGIDQVLIEREQVPLPGRSETRTQSRIRLMHKTAGASAPLDLSAESEGTKTWFRLIGPVLSALRAGAIILFDELDASLHPTLSAELVRLFQNPVTNPRHAQLLFTSHDTSLLNHLNRDEVWFTEKCDDGSTKLGALAEFASARVRKSQNLENAYLHGRFGAIPQIDQTELLRAMGLMG